MSATAPGEPVGPEADRAPGSESLSEVLASIRALVSAETAARVGANAGSEADVILLTQAMRVEPPPAIRDGEVLAEGLAITPARAPTAPILDEEALRGVINGIVREELQGELGDRISRNLRKLIRREIGQMLEDERKG